jgi:hypothetical protein
VGADGATVTLTWQAEAAPGREVKVAALAYGLDAGGTEVVVGQADSPLGTELYPSAWWRAGEVVRESRHFELSDFEASALTVVRIGLYDPVSGRRYARLDSASDLVDVGRRP